MEYRNSMFVFNDLIVVQNLGFSPCALSVALFHSFSILGLLREPWKRSNNSNASSPTVAVNKKFTFRLRRTIVVLCERSVFCLLYNDLTKNCKSSTERRTDCFLDVHVEWIGRRTDRLLNGIG